jgi:hypothetical protein
MQAICGDARAVQLARELTPPGFWIGNKIVMADVDAR